MTRQRRAEIEAGWRAIDRELADIAAGRAVADDPAKREAELLEEQDALDFELGQSYFDDAQ